jgi:hypothetical protein
MNKRIKKTSKPIQKMIKNRKAVSAVVSNLILIAAVIAVGFSVLSWSQGQSANYQKTHTDIVTEDINQLQERLSLENVNYNVNSHTLKLYLLNSGPVNVTIQTVYISSSPGSPPSFTVNTFNNISVPSKALNATSGQREGYVQVSQTLPLGTYKVTITTLRGSTFAYDFAI